VKGELIMKENGYAPWTFSETAGEVPIKLIKVTNDATLFQHWPWLEKRLNVVKRKDRSNEQWTPAHLRESVRKGFWGQSSVELWLGVNDEGVIEGFILTTVRVDPFVNLPAALTAWVLWGNEALINRALPQLEEIAKNRYLTAIEFFTSRQGWFKKASRFGFRLSLMQFRKELA
jgi:hypothetical protein